MQYSSVGISALEVARNLGAKHTVGRRMLGVAGDLGRASIFDRDMQGAGVGTVVRACAAHEGAAGNEGHGLIEWHRGNAVGAYSKPCAYLRHATSLRLRYRYRYPGDPPAPSRRSLNA